MSKTYYDARNANLTLGMEIIETNRNLKAILGSGLSREGIGSLEATIDWMDGYLQNYRKHMKIKFFDPEKNDFVEYKSYDDAIKAIHKNLNQKRHLMDEDPMSRLPYVFWLNRWCELQASCFHKLQLLPPPRMDENNRDMLDEEPEEMQVETLEAVSDDGYGNTESNPDESSSGETYPIQPE